ncbi:hypothetical protein GF361_05790 [Candidatus Woesearchaeota archaeon]|nr:hypothetical protein [Candidatus Woesearchaeota archaeon]
MANFDKDNKEKDSKLKEDDWFEKEDNYDSKENKNDPDPEDEPIKIEEKKNIDKKADHEEKPVKAEKKEKPKEEKPVKVEKDKIKISKTKMWQGISTALAVLLLISIFTGGFKTSPVGKATSVLDGDGFSAVILNDERCSSCDTTQLISQLSQTFPDLEINEMDYSEEEAKDIYESAELSALPAVLFTDSIKDKEGYANVENYLIESGDYLSLRIGAAFDPEAEICDNEVDDTGNGKVDCEDPDCSGVWKCMEKKEIPEVEAFVMSHCPYGTQIEKGLIPVIELLGNKADIQIRFCDYAMHGEKELDEQVRQYCIQEEQNDKYLDYLKCFLKDGDSETCVEETEIDKTKLSTCIGITDAKYKVTENFEDKSTWKGNFPTFNIFKEEVEEYGVRGSPTLVINGVTASTGRDPASLLDAVCTGFKEKPEECDEELSSANPSAGFGFEESDSATTATCG